MRTLFTARAIAASATVATLIAGGALPSASATSSGHRDDDDTAWVQVCQRIRGDGDHRARDDNRRFRATYRVEDEEDSQRVTLRGRRDCDTVEVVAGRVTVRVVREPRDTERTSPRRFSFRIDEGDTRTVTFRYRVDDDDHGHGGDRVAA